VADERQRVILSSAQLLDRSIHATDGDIGRVEDLYIEEKTWRVRYCVVETGSWFGDRRVLISPVSFQRVDADASQIVANITRDQVQRSPRIDANKPVSRQAEMALVSFFEWPMYWDDSDERRSRQIAESAGKDVVDADQQAPDLAATNGEGTRGLEAQPANPHLRSLKEMMGYAVRTDEGTVGEAVGFRIDGATWLVHAIEARPSEGGQLNLLPPDSINVVSWADREIHVTHLPRS
jgi:hypothetical protein